MKLREWIAKSNVELKKMAARLGLSERTIHNIARGDDMRLSNAMKIEIYTNHEVTCQDLLSQRVSEKLLASCKAADEKIKEKNKHNNG